MVVGKPDAERSDEQVIGQMLDGYMATQALHVTAKLGIIDVLRQGPRRAKEIARDVGAHEPSMRRFLGFLTALHLVAEDDEGKFTATAMGELLHPDHPRSIQRWALLLGAPLIWRPWGELYETVMTGQPAFDRVYGESFFGYLEHSPDDAAVFNAAMSSDIGRNSVILDAYDFSDVANIIDVGGCQGGLLQSILERYPRARGVLFDLPFVVADAREFKDSEVANRCELVGGDMFHSVPAGGDAYLLKRIIHDWSDGEAIQILRNCRAAMGNQGKVLLVEQIVQPSEMSPVSDLMMLVLVTGRERTEDEFRALYAAAGFKLTEVTPAGGYSVIEGVPL